MIDDSDVMSLLIDAADPRRIYASACSGIYRSDDSAAQWRKIQGIPYTARRTYAITQDPKQPAMCTRPPPKASGRRRTGE